VEDASLVVAALGASSSPVPIADRVEPFARLLRSEVALNMRNAADHMQGLAALLRAERAVPQVDGRWRRVGDTREPDVWFAWGEAVPASGARPRR
jgi:hypothetical protein